MSRYLELTRLVKSMRATPGGRRGGETAPRTPNLLTALSVSPAALDAYWTLDEAFESTTFTPEERQVILLAASRASEARYCVSAHTVKAEDAGLDWVSVERVRAGDPVADPKLEALRAFTTEAVNDAGAVSRSAWSQLHEAGFGLKAALEIAVGVALKRLTNTVNQMFGTPLDKSHAARAWSPEERILPRV